MKPSQQVLQQASPKTKLPPCLPIWSGGASWPAANKGESHSSWRDSSSHLVFVSVLIAVYMYFWNVRGGVYVWFMC